MDPPYGSSLKPIGYTWSNLACRIGHWVPIWQPIIGYSVMAQEQGARPRVLEALGTRNKLKPQQDVRHPIPDPNRTYNIPS
jgi:hypothetical protein